MAIAGVATCDSQPECLNNKGRAPYTLLVAHLGASDRWNMGYMSEAVLYGSLAFLGIPVSWAIAEIVMLFI